MKFQSRSAALFPMMLASLAWAASVAVADTIDVPADHASITAAIAAAEDGDTIRVAPGTYVENIDYSGKAITITGHYVPGGDWSLVKDTVIDGSAAGSATDASTVTVKSGEGRDSVLHGFTITGGAGTQWVDPQFPDYTWHGGGGVFIFQSSPTIRHCVIAGNHLVHDGSADGAQGGGVLTYGGYPLIHNTIITANQAEYGGGLVVDYSGAEVRNTVVADNTVADTYGGGGIWTIGASTEPIEITNCTVAGNVSGSYGGGILVWNSTVSLRNSIVWGNEQPPDFSAVDVAGSGEITISFSDVEGGAEGVGNADLDPMFSDESVYLLDSRSPCVDAGDPAPEFDDPESPAAAGRALWPALGGLRNDMGAWGGPGAVAVNDPPPTVVYLPAAASIAGAAGSFFVTDVEVNNPGTRGLNYRFRWLPRDADNSDPVESAGLTLAPGATARYRNVLGEVFGVQDSVGALAVVADAESILVMSRTCNLTDDGTFGQAVPGVVADDLFVTGERARILLMAENEAYRSNLGVLNAGPNPIVIVWRLHDADGTALGAGAVELPPFGNTQVHRLFSAHAPVEGVYVDVWSTTSGAAFTCYGSVVDNRTNDPTTVLSR